MQKQTHLPTEGGHYVLELFMKSSSFTRYLLDEILPRETFNNPTDFGNDLDDLFEECESLVVSLKTFKHLHKMLNLREEKLRLKRENQIFNSKQNISLSDEIEGALKVGNSNKFDEECIENKKNASTIPFKLIESFKELRALRLNSDLDKIKLYYCELCNDSSYINHKANEHFSSKQHSTSLISSTLSYTSYQCSICGLFIIATESMLKNIIDSSAHVSVDETVEALKNIQPLGKAVSSSEREYDITSSKEDMNLQRHMEDTSENLNKLDEAVSLNVLTKSSDNLNKDNFKQNSKAMVQKTYYMNKWFISPAFIECSEKLLNERLQNCFYCRPCDVGYTSIKDWTKHKNDPKHIKLMQDSEFRNACVKCFQCPLEIMASKKTVNVYLRYHKEKNHKKLKQHIKPYTRSYSPRKTFNRTYSDDKTSFSDVSDRSVERYERISKNPEKEKSASSLDISSNSFMPLEVPPKEYCEKKNLCEEGSNPPYNRRKQSVKREDPASLLFIKALHEKKRESIENNINSFKGVCFPCSSIISDDFDWIEHITKVHVDKRDNKNIEKECDKCNLIVYGKLDIDFSELWNIKEHNELDNLSY